MNVRLHTPAARPVVQGLVAAADRRHHRAPTRVLGRRLLRPQRRPARGLGGRDRLDSRRQGHRPRLPHPRGSARGPGL